MSNTIKTYLSLILIAAVFFMLGYTMQPVVVPEPEPVTTEISHIDTSVIEYWDGDFSEGNIRMIGAWYAAPGVIEDELGTQWVYDEVTIEPNEFLLIWVADNNTPEDTSDDHIIKVWSEKYN